MEIRKLIALLIAMQVTLLCFSQTQVQSREVKRIAGKAYLLSNGNQYQIRENVVLARLKAGKKQVRNDIKLIKSHSFGMLEIAVPDSVKTEEYIAILEKTGEFEYVEFDTYSKPCMSPNDTYYNGQWGPTHIHADEAWEITTGTPSVKIAVIEGNGFELNHPDLNLSVSEGVVLGPATMIHGTMVAGIIGAKTNNGIGIAGIAGGNNSEGSKIIPYHALYASQDIDAIYDAVAKGAKVINMSYTNNESSDYNRALTYAHNNGVTLVCASGNEHSPQIDFPASHEHTIAVGAIDSSNNLYPSSNYGEGLDLVDPGVNIRSTAPNDSNYYAWSSGTSFAAPHVSGVVALMLSVKPTLTPDEIRTILNQTAIKIKPIDYPYYMGWNEKVGHGLLNAIEAVLTAMDYSISGPSTICSASPNSYSIDNLPSNLPSSCSIIWNIDNSYFQANGSGNQCSVSYTGIPQYSVANLTATVNWMGSPIKSVTKRIVMHGTDMVAYGEQNSYVSPNGTFPYRQFTIPANNGLRTRPESLNWEEFDGKESLPINFIEENTRDPHPPVDLCGYGITEINGGNKVFLSSTRLDGMDISFSGYCPTYFYRSETSGFVIFEMPHNPYEYPVTLHAESNGHCHDFCLTFKVVPIPGVASGDDEIFVSLDGSMLYVTFYGIGEYNGNGQYYMPSYSVTISKIPAGTQVYSNTFPGTQSSFSVNTSSWTSGFYSIRIVQGNNIYTKSIYI